MSSDQHVAPEVLAKLAALSTCAIANAIETFAVRMPDEGFADSSIRCVFPRLPPVIGYAVTASVRCSTPPADRRRFTDRTDWWRTILNVPAPRIVVLQDTDRARGLGAFVGATHAHVLKALGCVAVVTDGAVRDLPDIESAGFPLFAGSVAVSHAYAHIVSFGHPVEIAKLTVRQGDLLHGDAHGVLSIPHALAARIPPVARELSLKDQRVIEFCRSPLFTIEELIQLVRSTP